MLVKAKTKTKGYVVGIAYLLLLAFITINIGPYLVFNIQRYRIQKEIKREIKQGVPNEELVIFDATYLMQSPSFSWHEKGKEFQLSSGMYDIVKTTWDNGKLIFKCINDKQEHQLFKNLAKAVSKKQANDETNKLIQVGLTNVFYETSGISMPFTPSYEVTQNFIYVKKLYAQPLSGILIPPPNYIV